MIAKQGTCPSMIRVLVTIKTIVMTNLHSILHISNNSSTAVREVVTFYKEQCLSDHYSALVTPPAYTPSIPFLATIEPTYTLLMRDEESKVTSDSVLECDMPATTPLPPTDNGEVDFDINSPLGEQVVYFLMKTWCDDTKPRFFDVTFSNPLFDFNDDFILCNDNPLFDEEFEDISNSDSMSRSIETSDLILEELTAEIGLDDSIPTNIDDRYYDSDVLPPPASKQLSLKGVERFDPFFSLTQSGEETRVMETSSFGFHHMPSPRPAAYSPEEVMYCYVHPHLTSGDGFDHGPKNDITLESTRDSNKE
ncbi:hypothetical protein Tco_0497024 [Tanacetum coccineum]